MANEQQRAQRIQIELQKLLGQLKEQDTEIADVQSLLGIAAEEVQAAANSLDEDDLADPERQLGVTDRHVLEVIELLRAREARPVTTSPVQSLRSYVLRA